MAYQAGAGMAGFDEQDAKDAADALAKMGQPASDAPVTQPPPMVPGADAAGPPSVAGTQLPPDQETSYQTWKSTLPPNLQSEGDYDLRGFYQKNPNFSVDVPGQHMTDEFKLPNHPTFSDESKYYNPGTSAYGGHWTKEGNNDVFVPNDPTKKKRIIEGPDAQSPPVLGADAAATAETPAETGAKAVAELGPPPQRPKYTGDPTKDVQINVEWQRQLTDYSTALARKQGEIAKQDADVTQRKAEREADAERASQAARQAEVDAYQQQRQARQQQIDDAIKEKASALSDLKHGGEQSFGDKLGAAIAIALGGIGQGLMLKGHVAGAQNEGLNAVNKRIADEDQRRKDRLAAASNAVLEARYGFKDAADNHRAGLNDIDTERAAKYRLIASEAEEQLRAQGATDQDIKTNAVVADALANAAKAEGAIHEREEGLQVQRDKAAAENKLAAAHLDLGERTLRAIEAQRRETAGEHSREFELKRADQLARDADRKEAAADKATVGSVRQNAVLGNLAEAEKAAKDVGEVSIDAINKLQTNTEQAKAGEHSATSGVVGNVLTRAARGVGLAARGQYDGIPPEEQKKITAANQVITHLTEMQQGKNIETLEQYRDRYSPYVPGLSLEEVRRREAALPGLVAEQRAIQDPKGVGTKRTAGVEPTAGGGNATPKAPQTDADQAREHLAGPKASALPPGAKPWKQGGRDGIILDGQFYPKR